MSDVLIFIGAAGALFAVAIATGLWHGRLNRRNAIARVTVVEPKQPSAEEHDGAVRSIQAAELSLPQAALEESWSAEYLERLARTYWRFLSRVTLGLIHVRYSTEQRSIMLFSLLKLITFKAPEYELDFDRGLVRWRIERGLLVARRGRNGQGHLQIEVQRQAEDQSGRACLRIEIEVASFYPAIAFGLSRRLYDITQSRIHVIVTHAFLRSLSRLDLAHSRVGKFASQQAS